MMNMRDGDFLPLLDELFYGGKANCTRISYFILEKEGKV